MLLSLLLWHSWNFQCVRVAENTSQVPVQTLRERLTIRPGLPPGYLPPPVFLGLSYNSIHNILVFIRRRFCLELLTGRVGSGQRLTRPEVSGRVG